MFLRKKIFYIALGLVASAALIMAILGLVAEPQRDIYERGYNQIELGDTKQSVVSVMGEPDERHWCYPLPTDHDTPERKRFHEQCVDEYWYVTFLKPYIIKFDKDNRVSGKNIMISH